MSCSGLKKRKCIGTARWAGSVNLRVMLYCAFAVIYFVDNNLFKFDCETCTVLLM